MRLTLRAPGSKSMTQRAIVLGAIADGPVEIRGALDCDDSRCLVEMLIRLGAAVRWEDGRIEVRGGKLCGRGDVLWCGNAGTAMRFGACLSLVAEGDLHLDGDARMRERPVRGLGDALRQLGVKVAYSGADGYPPWNLRRMGTASREVSVEGSSSSQFASGLMLVAPRLPEGMVIRLEGKLVSQSYVEMTRLMLQSAGAQAHWLDERTVSVSPGSVRGQSIEIEPDWSSAAFLLASGTLAGCEIDVPGLLPVGLSAQGDAVFESLRVELAGSGARVFDLTHTPDLIGPVAALAVFADGPTRIRGVAHTRIKESDRIAVLGRELRKLGVSAHEHADGLDIEPLVRVPAGIVELDPEHDHRMAMTFGALSLRIPGIRVLDASCVSKSFPEFWTALDRIREASRVGSLSPSLPLSLHHSPSIPHSVTPSIPLEGPVLVGLRGAGKTSVAPLVAELLELEWVDADAELERRDGRRIPVIFAEEGEAGFRKLELEVELELLERRGVVVATGGGAVLHEEVRTRLAQRMTVWLHAPVRVLARRIAGSDRPRLTDGSLEAELESQLMEREQLYREVATIDIDTSGLEPDDIARSIAGFWDAARRRH